MPTAVSSKRFTTISLAYSPLRRQQFDEKEFPAQDAI